MVVAGARCFFLISVAEKDFSGSSLYCCQVLASLIDASGLAEGGGRPVPHEALTWLG